MKILQLIQRKQLRGAEIFATQLSGKLFEKGHTSDLVYLFNGSDVSDDINRYISLEGNESRRFFDFSAFRRLAQIIKEGQYDLVQANAGDTLKYAALSKYLHRWKQPLIFRNANYISGFIDSRSKRYLNALWVRKCEHVISVSESCRLDFVNVFPVHRNSSTTITIGTELWDDVDPTEMKEELGIGEGPVFINVGSLVPEKNHEFLLAIFQAYTEQENRGHLLLAGDGKLRRQLQDRVKELGIQSRVHFLGYRNDVTGLLKASDLMLMPSKIEGMPGVILEALACGLPVIASSVGGIPEVIRSGLTGICLEKFNVQEYVDAMKRLLNEEDFRKKTIQNGQQLIEEKYTLDRVAGQFMNLYQEILSRLNSDG